MIIAAFVYVKILLKRGTFFSFYVLVRYSTLLHLPPLRFHCVGGCWYRAKDYCDFGIDNQAL
jgi:hypothetical protein